MVLEPWPQSASAQSGAGGPAERPAGIGARDMTILHARGNEAGGRRTGEAAGAEPAHPAGRPASGAWAAAAGRAGIRPCRPGGRR